MDDVVAQYAKVHEILRRPFPAQSIGKLPKPTRKDAQKGRCDECGGWHGLPAVHLDYVGHAAVTDRLLEADPFWTWEPMSLTDGTPSIHQGQGGNMVLWIKLRVAGMERIGVGTAPPGSFELEKQLIGDAIRNAAMRFGVALDLWAKEDLESAPHDETTVDETAEKAKQKMTDRQRAVNAAKRHVLDLFDGDEKRARVLWQEAVGSLGVIEKAMSVEAAQKAANLVADTMLDDGPVEVTKGEKQELIESKRLPNESEDVMF